MKKHSLEDEIGQFVKPNYIYNLGPLGWREFEPEWNRMIKSLSKIFEPYCNFSDYIGDRWIPSGETIIHELYNLDPIEYKKWVVTYNPILSGLEEIRLIQLNLDAKEYIDFANEFFIKFEEDTPYHDREYLFISKIEEICYENMIYQLQEVINRIKQDKSKMKKHSIEEVITKFVDINYIFNYGPNNYEFKHECDFMTKSIIKIFKHYCGCNLNFIFSQYVSGTWASRYKSIREEFYKLDPIEYKKWADKHDPILFGLEKIGLGKLHRKFFIKFEKDAPYKDKKDLFISKIGEICYEHTIYQIQEIINRIKLANNSERAVVDPIRVVKDYIYSILKGYDLCKYEIHSLADLMFDNYGNSFASLVDIISSLTKDDMLIELRLKLTDTTKEERRMLFLELCRIHLISLLAIRDNREKKDNNANILITNANSLLTILRKLIDVGSRLYKNSDKRDNTI